MAPSDLGQKTIDTILKPGGALYGDICANTASLFEVVRFGYWVVFDNSFHSSFSADSIRQIKRLRLLSEKGVHAAQQVVSVCALTEETTL